MKNKQYYFNIFKYVFLGIFASILSFFLVPFLLESIEIVFAITIAQFWKTAIIELSISLPVLISVNSMVSKLNKMKEEKK
jgi:hypothetical protein